MLSKFIFIIVIIIFSNCYAQQTNKTAWVQSIQFKANGVAYGQVGQSLGGDADIVLTGSGAYPNGSNIGSVFVFQRVGNVSSETLNLLTTLSGNFSGQQFG